MTHFEYMEQQGQLIIFDLMDEYELIQYKQSSTNVSRPVNKKKYARPKRFRYIVRGLFTNDFWA